jgi:hypothetical protein
MRKRFLHLALDSLFVLWMLQVLVTGRLVPRELVTIFYPEAPIVVITDPGDSDHHLLDPLPET